MAKKAEVKGDLRDCGNFEQDSDRMLRLTVSAVSLGKTYGPYWKDILRDNVESIPDSKSFKVVKPLPTPEEFQALKTAKYTKTLSDAFSDAFSDVQSLTEDMGSWRDNMAGTGLENTGKYSEVEEAASSLENLQSTLEQAEDFFSKEDSVGTKIKIMVFPLLGKSSRGEIAGSAASVLEEVSEALRQHKEETKDEELLQEIDDVTSYLDDATCELQNVSFPGMF